MKRIDELITGNKYTIQVERRLPEDRMGRFGGGWNYRLGLTGGNSELLINAEVFYMRLRLNAPHKATIVKRKIKLEDYTINFKLKLEPRTNFQKLLLTKNVTITSSKHSVIYKIVGIGHIQIIKL